VPQWVASAPLPVSHGLCEICLGFHWGRLVPTRVLVVDDDPAIRKVLGRILLRSLYEVTVVENAAEAREELAKKPFDALITDQEMPGEAGIDLARWALKRLAGMRCVIVSGGERPTDLETEIGWIHKPFVEADVLEPLPPAK
jgi:DNA-binding NtrC family response regulator